MLVSIVALVTTTVVLIAQNRPDPLRAATRAPGSPGQPPDRAESYQVIHLLEELRRDLPMVKDRHDAQADEMQERADTAQLASALDEVGLTSGAEEGRGPPRED